MNEKNSGEEKKGRNRLASEQSPYLRQHADNPVDWYPWGDEAFEKAKAEDKPIFLSIGYSTCHWCHVMERESFEDPEVAKLMNDAFVSIKVDREERPDLDAIYMNACQLLSGQGGWPLTIVMTPDKKPFYAATYLPRETMMGRVGMMDMVPRVKEVWNDQREKIMNASEEVTGVLNRKSCECAAEAPSETTLSETYRQLASVFDEELGGFGRSPKFPASHNLMFLLRYNKRTGQRTPMDMATRTLRAMRAGGIYDQVGFGFHRYSTDRQWLVPHFEKMLYDQAMLMLAYTEAYQATGEDWFARTVKETARYVLRDLASPEGGFYSAEDADSEGVEGKFYVWKAEEIESLLDEKEAHALTQVMGVTREGNFLEEGTGERTGKNILHLARPLENVAKEMGIPAEELDLLLESARTKLFEEREKRVRPSLDDKVLADWNGLIIAALAKAGAVLGDPEMTEAAKKAATFVLDRMDDGDGGLLHRYRDGEAGIPAFLDDYAFMVWGLIELYEATYEPEHLENAILLNKKLMDHFQGGEAGGFFLTPDYGEENIARHRDAYDGAIPSGNSVAAMNLARLSRLVAEPEYERKAEQVLRSFFCDAQRAPAGYTFLMSALDFAIGPASEVVVIGERGAEDTGKMLAALHSGYHPNKVTLFRPAGEEGNKIDELAEFVKGLHAVEGKATAYVCKNWSCELPTADPGDMLKLLGEVAT